MSIYNVRYYLAKTAIVRTIPIYNKRGVTWWLVTVIHISVNKIAFY